jgi:surface protein
VLTSNQENSKTPHKIAKRQVFFIMTGLFLVFAAALSSAIYSPDYPYLQTVYAEDFFNRTDNGIIEGGWTEIEQEGSLDIISEEVIAVASDFGYTVLQKYWPGAYPDYISFSMSTINMLSDRDTNIVMITDGGFQSSNILQYIYVGPTSVQTTNGVVLEYTPGQKISVEFKNINYTTHTYDLYIDGLLLENESPFYQNIDVVKGIQWFLDENTGHQVSGTLDDVVIGSSQLIISVCNSTFGPCGDGCVATDLGNMFDGISDFNNVVGDITGWDTSCVTNMAGLFANSNFNQDIGGWDTSSVVDMQQMFMSDLEFDQDISSWDTSQVRSMASMFSGASAFDQPLGLWDVSQVNDMSGMFLGATVFDQDLGGWNTGNVNSMNSMFLGASAFDEPLGLWDVGQVNDMTSMFDGASVFDQDLGGWNTGNVNSMSAMFSGASAFDQPLGSWDVSQVNDMAFMFANASAFNQNISSWDTTNVNDMTGMFQYDNLSTRNYDSLLISWSENFQNSLSFDGGYSQYSDAGKVGRDILEGTYAWTITDGGPAPTDCSVCSESCSPCGGGCLATNLSGMFLEVTDFDSAIGNISGWNVSCVADMHNLFYHSDFNQPIGSWDVSQVLDMSGMFENATEFNQDLSAWNTSNVTSMSYMFYQASAFNQQIGSWDTSHVLSMDSMFSGANLSTASYDALLNGWGNKTQKSNVSFDGGNSMYSSFGLEGRNILTGAYNWTITDGGADVLADAKLAALDGIAAAFALYDSDDYSEYNWALLTGFYANSSAAIDAATTLSGVETVLAAAAAGMSSVLKVFQTAPDADGNVHLNNITYQAVISNQTQIVVITVENSTLSPTINVGSFITNGTGIIPQIIILSSIANVSIPATSINCSNLSWNGVLNAPVSTTAVLPEASGETRTLSLAVELGCAGSKLSLGNAARILFPNNAGRRVGYLSDGMPFTEIIDSCEGDNQSAGDAMPFDRDCALDSEDDLTVWTKHFTIFILFSSLMTEEAPAHLSRGGGGGGVACIYDKNYDWACSEWGGCISGKQTRTCKSSNNCGNSYGKPTAQRACNVKADEPAISASNAVQSEAVEDKKTNIALFDIITEIVSEPETAGDDLVAKVSLINFGSSGTVDANLEYTITDSEGKIVKQLTDTVPVTTQSEFLKYINTTGLAFGKYKLKIVLKYEGQTDPASSEKAFSINQGPQLGRIWSSIIIAIIIVIIIATSATGFFYARKKGAIVGNDRKEEDLLNEANQPTKKHENKTDL